MLDMDVIYREYADSIFRFLMTLCGEVCTAEELTQETFYQAVRSAHKYDGTCKVSTWLCQIAKHLWYRELDKRKRKGTSMLEESMVSDKAGPEDELCIREEKMDVFKKVHILDETARAGRISPEEKLPVIFFCTCKVTLLTGWRTSQFLQNITSKPCKCDTILLYTVDAERTLFQRNPV